jgi:quercetin dioxygenase-like cupin family protein
VTGATGDSWDQGESNPDPQELKMAAKDTPEPDAAQQQAPGINRVDLQHGDLSVPGREVIQNRVELSTGAPPFRHFHYGEEVIYVLEGKLEYTIEGEGTRTVSAGEALTVPAQAIHSVKNVGEGVGIELATYIVEKGKPLITLAE